MSEQNILNPTNLSLFSPDWGYTEGLPETRSMFQAASGKMYARREFGLGRVYDLAWNNRDLATKHALQQWAQQYENDFFSLADWERARYFTGRFESPLTFNPVGNQKYNIKGRFIELPGLPMFAAPNNWARDAIFLEERNGFGEDLVKLLTPANWTYTLSANFHGGADYTTAATNETAEWVYFGYGFQVWANKDSNRGIMSVQSTRVRDGASTSVTNVDLYSASNVPSAAVYTNANPLNAVTLDFWRVKLTCTGTKNASSTGYMIDADAIQVMQ